MPKLTDVCRYVRSKAAGPFWITVDLFFDGPESFTANKDKPGLNVASIASRLQLCPELVKRIEVPDLSVIKFSYPRNRPQGGVFERDMHGGQQFTPLLDLDL
ncbi:DUF4387 domain-containing protein [Niveispirillum sp. KHB5.9]|uniref:DUF4387 domain-containing protein n=1 Tax=Niveispirillum sp. KHB5.9 TaxID=3400269 RepID=UPI003A875025